MCGLVGIAGDTSGTWKDVFAELLLFDVVRGPHSTGVGFVNRNDHKFSLVKRPGHPFNIFDTEAYEKGMSSPTNVIFGHNRYATVGEKTEANAHPFMFNNIMGMHNGTLEKWSLKEIPDFDKYGTDSEAIFAAINNNGVKDTLAVMQGAWALIWYDKRDQQLHFLRNDRRPLHYCYSADRCTLIWSSELELLRYVMNRRNKKIPNDEIFMAEKDTLYTWKVPQSINGKFDTPERVEQKGKVWATTKFTNHFSHGSTNGKGTSTQTTSTSTPWGAIVPFDNRLKTKKFRQPYKDQNGRAITKSQFTDMVQEGCAFCNTNDQPWGSFVQIMGPYIGKYTAYSCESCFNDAELYDYTQYAV